MPDCKLKYRIRFARPGDIPGIIELMRPYNMHHSPSTEEESWMPCYFISLGRVPIAFYLRSRSLIFLTVTDGLHIIMIILIARQRK